MPVILVVKQRSHGLKWKSATELDYFAGEPGDHRASQSQHLSFMSMSEEKGKGFERGPWKESIARGKPDPGAHNDLLEYPSAIPPRRREHFLDSQEGIQHRDDSNVFFEFLDVGWEILLY